MQPKSQEEKCSCSDDNTKAINMIVSTVLHQAVRVSFLSRHSFRQACCCHCFAARAHLETCSQSRLLGWRGIKFQMVNPACQWVHSPPQGSLHRQSLVIQLQHHYRIKTCKDASPSSQQPTTTVVSYVTYACANMFASEHQSDNIMCFIDDKQLLCRSASLCN